MSAALEKLLFLTASRGEDEALVQTFEDEAGVPLVVVDTVQDAWSQLEDPDQTLMALMIDTDLPAHEAINLTLSVQDRWPDPEGRLPVILVSAAWKPEDLRRAVQAGADAFFTRPVGVRPIMAELRIMGSSQAGMTRARLANEAGTAIYQFDSALWTSIEREDGGPDLVARVRRRMEAWDLRLSQRAEDLAGRLAQKQGRVVTRAQAHALEAWLAEDDPDPHALAESHKVEVSLFDHAGGILLGEGASPVALQVRRTELQRTVEHLVELAAPEPEAVEEAAPPTLSELRALAEPVAMEGAGPHNPRTAPFQDGMRLFFGWDEARISALDPQLLEQVAEQLTADDPSLGLGRVRMMMLRQLYAEGDLFLHAPPALVALAGVLGVGKGCADGGSADAIKQVVIQVDPEDLGLYPDLARLSEVADTLSQRTPPPGVDTDPLIALCRDLSDADQPGGELDKRRVKALNRALLGGARAYMGRVSLRALSNLLDQSPDPLNASGLRPTLDALGVSSERALEILRDRLSLLVGEFEGPPVFAEHLRKEIQRALELGPVGPLGHGTPPPIEEAPSARAPAPEARPAPVAPAREAEPAPSPQPARAPARRAVASLAHRVKRRPKPVEEPKAPAPEESRFRRMRSGPDAEIEAVALKSFVAANKAQPEVILGRLRVLKRSGDQAAVRQLRQALGLRGEKATTVADITSFMDKSRIESAFVGLWDLPDEQPQVLPLLNEVGLALRFMGSHDASEAAYARATRIKPERPDLWFNYARVLVEAGRPEAAAPLLRKALQRAPDLMAARQLLTRIGG